MGEEVHQHGCFYAYLCAAAATPGCSGLSAAASTAAPVSTTVEFDYSTGIARMHCGGSHPRTLAGFLLQRRDHFQNKSDLRKAIQRGRVQLNGQNVGKAIQHSLVYPGDVLTYRLTSYSVLPTGGSTAERSADSSSGGTVAERDSEALRSLLARQSALSDSQINRFIKRGAVLVDGKKAGSRMQHVSRGQTVEWRIAAPPVIAYIPEMPLAISVENEHLAAVVKPAGLPMDTRDAQGPATSKSLNSAIAHALKPSREDDRLCSPTTINQLDAAVGGFVICAKTKLGESVLRKAFEQNQVRMTYRALVVGKPLELRGNWGATIEGAEASTDFVTLRSTESLRFGFISELELTPLTLLKDQLRIHCSLAGCPIVDDVKYGGDQNSRGKSSSALFLSNIALIIDSEVMGPLQHTMDASCLTLNCDPPEKFDKFWQREAAVWSFAMSQEGVEHITSDYVKELKLKMLSASDKQPHDCHPAVAEDVGAPLEPLLLQSDGEISCWSKLSGLVPAELAIPCAYFDQSFLSPDQASKLLDDMVGEGSKLQWSMGGLAAKRYTCVHCDPGLTEYAGGPGYASDEMRPWTPELSELRDRVEEWHWTNTGRRVAFNVALINRYDDGKHCLGYHSDREEIDPALFAPRASPIASVSLGYPRQFSFVRVQLPNDMVAKGSCDFGQGGKKSSLQLGHGSILCMENACQFLFRHSLLPEPGLGTERGPRVNLTFRSKTATSPAPAFRTRGDGPTTVKVLQQSGVLVDLESRKEGVVFVGLMPGVKQVTAGKGFKDTLFHPFESPFVKDEPRVAAARYRSWLTAQPAFLHWICAQLRGKVLLCADSEWDIAHAQGLAAIANAGNTHLE